jgi:hypothetical protein
VFVTNDGGRYFFGYEACQRALEPIQEFSLEEGDGEHPGPTVWRLRLASGPPVTRIELGVVPAGYEVKLAYRPLTTRRFSFDVTAVGRGKVPHGIATEFTGLTPGHVRWSGGTRSGTDLHAVSRSVWAC